MDPEEGLEIPIENTTGTTVAISAGIACHIMLVNRC